MIEWSPLTLERNQQYGEISFCLQEGCVQQGLRRYSSQEIKPFTGIVWTQAEDLVKLPSLSGIQWQVIW
jgi:hypothetical protein